MRVITWNLNSARSRVARLLGVIERHGPDVVALQETKCSDAQFDELVGEALASRGYEVAHHGANHWNGVAIASRVGLDEVRRGFDGVNRGRFDEPRLVSAVCGEVEVWSVYAPNGRALDDPHYLYKLVWLERLRSQLDAGRPTLAVGDFNVAPTDADIYDPKRWRNKTHASPAERAAIEHLLDLGLVDVMREHLPAVGTYTWWNYRAGQFDRNRGLRIDLALASPDVAARVVRVEIDTAERADDHPHEKPSDHAPIIVDLHP